MNAKHSRKRSATNHTFLSSTSDEGIDFSDIPPLTPAFRAKATLRMPAKKEPVTLRLDHDVLAWFRTLGRGYQTRINAVLRSYVQATRHG